MKYNISHMLSNNNFEEVKMDDLYGQSQLIIFSFNQGIALIITVLQIVHIPNLKVMSQLRHWRNMAIC